MRDKPVGGKKKPVARRSADAAAGAASAAAKREFAKFGEYLRASDVGGKGRSAAAGRRQGELKKAVAKNTASKIGGYAPSAPSAASREGYAKVSRPVRDANKRRPVRDANKRARTTLPRTK